MSLLGYLPGRLDRRVNLFYPSNARDAGGGVVRTWNLVSPVWAEYNPSTGRELQQAGQKLSMAQAIFRIRYRSDVTAIWRVTYDNSTYELVAPPVPVGRKQYLDLVCRALAPGNTTGGMPVDRISGFEDLALDDEEKTVTFASHFSVIPTVWCCLVAPDGTAVFTVEVGTVTRYGFEVTLGAATPAEGYQLAYIAAVDPEDAELVIAELDLAQGAEDDIVLAFLASLDDAPSGYYIELVPPTVDDPVFPVAITKDSATASQLVAAAGAAVPSAGYKMKYILLP